jgi:hypothetical protein
VRWRRGSRCSPEKLARLVGVGVVVTATTAGVAARE